MIQKKTLIFGATGMLGQPVTKALLSSGFSVRIASREVSKASKLFPGEEVVGVDLKDKESLSKALDGIDRIYLNLSVSPEEKKTDFHSETDGLSNLLSIAEAKSISRIVMISSLVKNYQGKNGFNWWAFDLKEKAVEILKSSGIPHTIFYPSSFMENFIYGYKQGKKLILAGTSKHLQYWIAGSDYGKTVAAAFQNESSNNFEYAVQGEQGLNTDEAAEIFVDNYSKEKLTISKAPMFALKILGLFNVKYNYTYHILEALNQYPEKFESENTWRELHKPEVTLERYAKELSE